jgi:hypothetical protein
MRLCEDCAGMDKRVSRVPPGPNYFCREAFPIMTRLRQTGTRKQNDKSGNRAEGKYNPRAREKKRFETVPQCCFTDT